MAGKTPKIAVDNFLSPIRLVLSCFTKAVIFHGGSSYELDGGPYAAMIGKDGKFKLPGTDFSLSVSMNYKIVKATGERGPYKVKTTAYLYGLEDKDGKEIVGYHWHPEGTDIPFPHLHIGPSVASSSSNFKKKHLPTGRVALEQVLRLAVQDFGVRPTKAEWGDILNEAQRVFERWRTWH